MARRGKNEGTIYKRKNGTWRAQVSLGNKRIGYTANSRAECHEWLRKMLDQIDQGMSFESRNITFQDYLTDWINIKSKSLRAKTAFQYRQIIDKYIFPELSQIHLKDLNIRIINRFLNKLVNGGLGARQVRYIHSVMHSALEAAVKNGALGKNPSHGAVIPKSLHKEMRVLSEQEVSQLLIAASSSRLKSLYQMAITTGMRQAELLGLRWEDVDWIKGTITIKRQTQYVPHNSITFNEPKTRSGIRTIKLGENTLIELRNQRNRIETLRLGLGESWKDFDLVFPSTIGTPMHHGSLMKDFHRVLRKANLPKIRFHDLRHTAASIMLNHNVPVLVVSKILGHANPSITLNTYAHCFIDMQNQAFSLMDEIVTPIPIDLPKELKPATKSDNS